MNKPLCYTKYTLKDKEVEQTKGATATEQENFGGISGGNSKTTWTFTSRKSILMDSLLKIKKMQNWKIANQISKTNPTLLFQQIWCRALMWTATKCFFSSVHFYTPNFTVIYRTKWHMLTFLCDCVKMLPLCHSQTILLVFMETQCGGHCPSAALPVLCCFVFKSLLCQGDRCHESLFVKLPRPLSRLKPPLICMKSQFFP